MSTTSEPTPRTAAGESNSATLDDLARQLTGVGVPTDIVNRLADKLRACNIFTMGALRAFHMDSMEALTLSLFDDSALGKMQANGLLATLRVRASPSSARDCCDRAQGPCAPPTTRPPARRTLPTCLCQVP